MSEQKIFIAGYIPDDKSVEEFGARRVATSFNAKDMKHARAKASFLFMEEYPGSQDAAYKILICEDTPGVPCRPVRGVWDEEFLYKNDWPEDIGHPVLRKNESEPVDFDSLSKVMQNAVLVKFDTTEVTKDMLLAALKLTQEEEGTFEGHIVEAINKTPEINAMYPERKLFAIGWVKHKCSQNKKWPEIKAELFAWKKRQDSERKETGPSKSIVEIAREKAANQTIQQIEEKAKVGSGDPDRFDTVVALLVMGLDPETANATQVKHAKHIKESRDPAWRAWRTTLIGIPGIYLFPESELYALTLDGMKDLSLIKDDDARRAYVREHFAGHELLPDYLPDGEENESEAQEPQNADELADDPSESDPVEQEQSTEQPQEGKEVVTERQGPFYFLFPDGEKVGRANKLPGLNKALSDGCTEISQEEYQARKNGTYKAPQENVEPRHEQPEVKSHGNGIYSVDSLMAEQPKNEDHQDTSPSNEGEKTENDTEETLPRQPSADFQSVGDSLEKELSEKPATAQDNLNIWRNVMRTDPRFTKELSGTGFEGTSINAEYMVMRATELFGPIGSRWGFEILEDRMLPGAPLSEAIYEDKKFICNRMLRDADGTLLFEQNHSIKIRLWYQTETDEGSVYSYGATPYLYRTKHGLKCDGEAQKKSLTDAIKKGLSLLGFSADVWLGLYDQPEYQEENRTEFAIKNASDKAGDTIRLRKELDERIERNLEIIRSAVTTNEAKGVYSTITREVDVYRKDAQAKADNEFDEYLKKRLLVLHRAVEQKVSELENVTKQEQSA
ncbi:exodeoxyribonuclease VIII [Citrobacter koseri]|uniref:exodeoxyribonuclease VIII n=1 Tax=Citrobacter koseri TaxID=545 RepID=UPI00192A7290|nr:exodeoxyribonuclease VIII [Citrobacter koseri]MBL4562305.1 exodeoxyribonuclease VIII [Citrobacter koseri]